MRCMSSSSRNTVNESTEPITFQKILESTRHRSALRKSLAAHEDAKDGYARRLKAFLAKVDAFFGDADLAMQRFYLLREQAALWTAPAFDRCLLLALFYPVMTIFVIWAVSGEVGPAEQALQLKTADGPHRFAAITLVGN
jgi:hypothetical protein